MCARGGWCRCRVHLRDSHYTGAKRLGHGEGYQYAAQQPDGVAAQDYLGIEREYYRPVDRGFERELAERLETIRARLRPKKGRRRIGGGGRKTTGTREQRLAASDAQW